jgi:gluconate:H+ symporter, GntP family
MAGMQISIFQFTVFLIIGISIIFLLSIKYRIPAFYSLMIACLIVGMGLQLPPSDIISDMKEGFGNIMKSLGFIIVLGTALGLLLAHTGSSKVMADFILRLVGERNAPLGISITGFIVGLPVFCDSGYIVLSGLNRNLSKRSGTPLIITSVSLATALLSVHCMIPPHPGAAAAAATIGVDYGKLMLAGIGIAIPAMLTGYAWARYAGKKIPPANSEEKEEIFTARSYPSVIKSFLPVITPILLIALKSFLGLGKITPTIISGTISFLGDPVMALTTGVLIAFTNGRSWKKKEISLLLSEAAEKAGVILVIIGAGGAFGAVLAAGRIGEHFSRAFPLGHIAILFPFLLTFILKTAQGSSTVAIITASSIMLPLLPALGLNTETGKLLCVLSMGAGSMMISHANDAYFWVITEFSGLEVKSMLKVYSLATFFMGVISFISVYLLSLFMK